jgi:hypothetical protein
MTRITSASTITEVAVVVSQALEAAGIRAPLSGGAAVSIYSDNQYESVDLDFITSERNAVLAKAIETTGYTYQPGRKDFIHPDTRFTVEFPPGPLAFGSVVAASDEAVVIDTRFGPLRVVTPSQSVMDRLAHFVQWGDRQALDQAVLVARGNDIDWPAVAAWAEVEGMDRVALARFRKAVERD